MLVTVNFFSHYLTPDPAEEKQINMNIIHFYLNDVIDVSIWLHQLVKGFRDKDGNPLPNAHLLGVFHRVCKLINSGIKPVFVFDGGVPVLKRQTLAARKARKLESLDKADLARQRIVSAYLQRQLQRHSKQSLPPSLRMQAQIARLSKSPSVSPKKRLLGDDVAGASTDTNVRDEVRVDEDLEAFRAALVAKLEDDVDEVDPKYRNPDSEEDDDDDAGAYKYGVDYSENFSVIERPDFDALPLETQHEILFEMQESKKMNSWGKFDKMPKDLQSFSSYQMDRLVKRRTLQKKIQTVQQEMGQRHIHVQNLDELLQMDYSAFENKETQVVGSKSDGFVLIRSQEPKKKEEPKPGTSAGVNGTKPEVITIDDFIEDSFSDDEEGPSATGTPKASANKPSTQPTNVRDEDEDLKLAIQLSLMESQKKKDKDEEKETIPKESNVPISTNNTKPGKSEKQLEERQESSNPLESIQSSQMSHCAKFLDAIGFHMPSSSQESSRSKIASSQIVEVDTSNQTNDVVEIKEDGSSDEDDDFEEVVAEEDEQHPIASTSVCSMRKSKTGVIIDLTAIQSKSYQGEDIFADIFTAKGVVDEEGMDEIPKEESDTELVTVKERTQLEIEEDGSGKVEALRAKVDIDTKWDSDSEIEADLVEMVMAESVVTAGNDKTESREERRHQSDSLPSTSANIASLEHNETPEINDAVEDKTRTGQVKMITAEYMQSQDKLNSKLDKLHSEMGYQERVATSISDQMQIETQELISLFGIPYVISPTEAESQCAFLDKACLNEGSITDDSDVWLFGGQRFYKNFFSQGQKHIEFYQAADIQRVLNLNREKLIALAMMIGCDYSDGIQGVGPVLALEILSEFSSTGDGGYESLEKFREWWDGIQIKKSDVFSGSKLKEKLRKLKLRPGFPNKSVYEAFTNPSIDTSTEPFKWGNPDLDAIRTYTQQKFGWEQSKCDSLLLPVLKNLRCEVEQSRQLTLDAYLSFGKMPSLEGGKRKMGSKRMQTAVKKLKRVGLESHELNLSSESSDSENEEEKRKRKSKASKRRKPLPVADCNKVKTSETLGPEDRNTANAAEDQLAVPSPSSRAVASPRIPRMVEVIPQRVQSESDKMKNKQKAIEIFKKRKGK